jgi:hypothetical protein
MSLLVDLRILDDLRAIPSYQRLSNRYDRRLDRVPMSSIFRCGRFRATGKVDIFFTGQTFLFSRAILG